MAGSLIQVDTFTIGSAVSSVIIGGGSSGSSSYNFAINTNDPYLLTYQNVFMSNDGASFSTRFTVSGTGDSSSNYDQASIGMYSNTTFYRSGNVNLNALTNYGMGTTTQESQSGWWYLYNFANASQYSFMVMNSINVTETPEYVGAVKGADLKESQATDGVQIYANSGNISNGTFTLYKVV